MKQHSIDNSFFSVYPAASSKGVLVSTSLDKSPVVGEPIRLTVKVTNRERVAKKVEVHINAQAKDYSHNPSDTFWENHDVIQLGPMEGTSACLISTYNLILMPAVHVLLPSMI